MADHRNKRKSVRQGKARAAAAEWYLVAKSHIDQLYRMSLRMVDHLEREPGSPFHEVFDLNDLRALCGALCGASCRIADIAPIVGESLPDPLAALD